FAWSKSKTLYRWDDDAESLGSITLPLADTPPAAPPSIAIGSDGSAWVGINDALVHVSPTLELLSMTPIGEFKGVPAAEKFRPDDLHGIYPIISVSVSGDAVAVAAEDASSIRVFDASGGS